MQIAIPHWQRGLIALLAAGSLLLPLAALANTNNMLAGGCSSRSNCGQQVSTSDLRSFYNSYGVDRQTLQNSQYGTVTRSGDVVVNGQVIATHAQSYGRTYLSGSTSVGPVYRRSTSVSFLSSSLAAWVYAPNGHFRYALLTSCGNLVTATPKMAPPPPAPHHQAPAPQPQPAPAPKPASISNTNVVKVIQGGQSQTQNVTPTPAPTPAPTPTTAPAAPAAQTQPLPQTGATTTGLAGLSILLTTAWYYWRSRRGIRWALLQHGSDGN